MLFIKAFNETQTSHIDITGTIVNGTGKVTLPYYEQNAIALFGGSNFYYG